MTITGVSKLTPKMISNWMIRPKYSEPLNAVICLAADFEHEAQRMGDHELREHRAGRERNFPAVTNLTAYRRSLA